jgi:hypothetical protein
MDNEERQNTQNAPLRYTPREGRLPDGSGMFYGYMCKKQAEQNGSMPMFQGKIERELIEEMANDARKNEKERIKFIRRMQIAGNDQYLRDMGYDVPPLQDITWWDRFKTFLGL